MFTEQLSQNLAQYAPLIVISAALILERLLRLPSAWHPQLLLRSLARRLAEKVNHPERHQPQQQRLAGLMSLLLLLLLFVPLPVILRELSAFPWLLDCVLLMVCLSWRPMQEQLRQLALCHPEQQKQLRRTLVGHWLARDCSKLSPLGIRKAAIEAIYLRSWHHQVAILFWYLLTGITGALIYKVLLEASQSWAIKDRVFSTFPCRFRSILEWLPQSLWAGWLLLTTFRALSQANLQRARQFSSKPRGLMLLAATAQHGCDTGGPAYYGNHKVERPRIQGRIEPQEPQIMTALRSINLRIILLLALIWLVVVMAHLWLT